MRERSGRICAPFVSWPPTTCSPPDRLSERQVEDYILYVRDELAVAKGTFQPMFFGLKFFYVQTLGYQWPLFTKKKSASHATSDCPTSAPMTIVAA